MSVESYRAQLDADRNQRRMSGATTNPNATPGAGRGSLNSGSAGVGQPGSATPRLDAGVQTPRLDSNPARDSTAVLADRNRTGAFGIGAQNLQQRKDLFTEMGSADPTKRDAFKGRAAALGVTGGGWESAMGKLNMTPQVAAKPAAPATPATPAPKFGADIAKNNTAALGQAGAVADYFNRAKQSPGIPSAAKPAVTPPPSQTPSVKPTAQTTLATNAPTPEVSPAAPLPGQSPTPTIATPWSGSGGTWQNKPSFTPAPTAQPAAPMVAAASPPDKLANGGMSTPAKKPAPAAPEKRMTSWQAMVASQRQQKEAAMNPR